MKLAVFLLNLGLVLCVDVLELLFEIGQAQVTSLESFYAESKSIVIVSERLNNELQRDLHQSSLDDVFVYDSAEKLSKRDEVSFVPEAQNEAVLLVKSV